MLSCVPMPWLAIACGRGAAEGRGGGGVGDARAMSEILTALEIKQLARFDEHWRVTLAGDNSLLVSSLAQRGFFDVLKRRVPLYRLSDLGREALRL